MSCCSLLTLALAVAPTDPGVDPPSAWSGDLPRTGPSVTLGLGVGATITSAAAATSSTATVDEKRQVLQVITMTTTHGSSVVSIGFTCDVDGDGFDEILWEEWSYESGSDHITHLTPSTAHTRTLFASGDFAMIVAS